MKNIKLLCIYSFILFVFGGCSSHLSILVIDSKTGEHIDDLIVYAKPSKMPIKMIETDGRKTKNGVVDFKDIKNTPITIVIPRSEFYFSDTLKISDENNLKTIEIRLDSLQSILFGKVVDKNFKGIENCLITTDPMTDSTTTDLNGNYFLKSKKFIQMQYDIKASHPNYQNSR